MVNFFQVCSAIDYYKIIDFALHRYNNIDILLNMEYLDAILVLNEGKKEVDDARLWSQYLTIYPKMTEENFISYQDFKADAYKPPEAKATKDSILLGVKDIIELTVR